MFARISRRYDLANTILSLGLHYRWRKRAVAVTSPGKTDRILDLACGTGDLAAAFSTVTGNVVGVDFSRAMLSRAMRKYRACGIRYELADILHLPHRDDSFDVCSIAFGIRNADDPFAALREMRRVVKSGGRIIVLEFGRPEGMRGIPYHLYSRFVIPLLGVIITGDRNAYVYLHSSSSRFPSGKPFTRMMEECGIRTIRHHAMHAGLVHLYLGLKE